MKFIALEGLDGAGKSTQLKLLKEWFYSKGLKYKYLHFPRTESPFYGEMVAKFLRGDFGNLDQVDPYLVAILYAGDRRDASQQIENAIKDETYVIVDRYVYSNIAYQCAKLELKEAKNKLKDWILDLEFDYNKMIKPDISIFLDVPFEFTKNSLTNNRGGDDRDYLEVETPMMHSLAGGAAGKPFKTHLEALNMDLFLRIAPELYLKKLLVGDLEKVYEINRSFRNEGLSTKHNPEFTMLEVYTAYADYKDMMELVKGIILHIADNVLGTRELIFHSQTIDLSNWEEVSFAKLMRDNFDINPDDPETVWLEKLKKKGVKVELKEGKISRTFILNQISDLIEEKLQTNHPVFITDIYTELCPLAKKKKDNPLLSERFELFMGGMEVANAYSELNDPQEQRERFLLQASDEGCSNIDEGFVEALEYGMPPAGGLGIGIDRLVMLFTNQSSIKDVILFPQLKPELQDSVADSEQNLCKSDSEKN